MRVTTGVDIIEVSRVKELIDEHGDSFITKIFTSSEIEYCEKAKINKEQRYAVRFCAKEAVFKALDLDSSVDMEWKDIEIDKLETGRPVVILHGLLKEKEKQMINMDISLSHIEQTAIASANVLWQ